MSYTSYGIDLGTSSIRIYNSNEDAIFMEKNMIAIRSKNVIFAYGDSAYEMYEKAPGNITISYPLSNGVIADIKNMETLIKFFINALSDNNLKPSDYYIAVPTDVSEVEKKAFYDLIKESNIKAKRIFVVEKAIADGLGMDIDIKNSQGVLVVDVGFNTTEITILSLGGIVLSKLIKTGGCKFDEAIMNTIRKEFSLFVGTKTAEKVKIDLKELEAKKEPAVVYGRDILTGLPVERKIPTDIINETLQEPFQTIIENIKVILERTPPELAADIYKHGVYLTGGGSLVSHLAEKIEAGIGLKVNMADNPLTSAALGLSTIIKDDNYKSVAYSIEGTGR